MIRFIPYPLQSSLINLIRFIVYHPQPIPISKSGDCRCYEFFSRIRMKRDCESCPSSDPRSAPPAVCPEATRLSPHAIPVGACRSCPESNPCSNDYRNPYLGYAWLFHPLPPLPGRPRSDWDSDNFCGSFHRVSPKNFDFRAAMCKLTVKP
jgi:hypothetical protein